jgi:hypothetical protein
MKPWSRAARPTGAHQYGSGAWLCPATDETAHQLSYFRRLGRMDRTQAPPKYSETLIARIGVEGWPNEICNAGSSLLLSMKAEHIGNRTAQRSGERDGGLFYRSYSIVGRELRLMIFSDIAKCV